MATKEQYFEAIEHALSLPCPDDMAQYLSTVYLTEQYDELAAAELHSRYLYDLRLRHHCDDHRFSHPTYWLTASVWRFQTSQEYYPNHCLVDYWKSSEHFDYTNNKPKSQT